MATVGGGQIIASPWSALAGEDLTDKEGYVVTIRTTDFNVFMCDAQSDYPVGIIIKGAASGLPVQVAGVGSLVKAKCNGTIARDSPVKFDTGADQGKIIEWVEGTDGHDHGATYTEVGPIAAKIDPIVGIALEDGVDDQEIVILFNPQLL